MTPCCSFQNLNLICDFKVSLRPLIHSSFQWLKVEGGSLSLAPAALMVEQRGGITKVETLFLLPVKRWSVSVFGSLSMGTVWTRWQSQGDNFTDSRFALKLSPWLPSNWTHVTFFQCVCIFAPLWLFQQDCSPQSHPPSAANSWAHKHLEDPHIIPSRNWDLGERVVLASSLPCQPSLWSLSSIFSS